MKHKWGVAGFVGFLLAVAFAAPAPIPAQEGEEHPAFERGLQAYFQGKYEAAREDFQKAVEAKPENARYHFFLGNSYRRLDRDTGAVEAYQNVIERDTDHETARRRLADLYYEREDWDRAVEHYRHLVSDEEDNVEVQFRLAKSYFERGDLDRAKTGFLRVREVAPERADVYFYLGRILLQREEYLNAISRFNRAVELDDSVGEYYYYRALARFRQEDYLSDNRDSWKSATDFQRSLDRGFETPRTHFMLGNSLLNRGLYLLREDQSERGVSLLQKSIRQYRQVLAGEWKASNAYHNMGVAYLGIGKLDMARKAVEQAILIEPTTPFFHDTLGDVYFRQGNFEKAIESWQLVQELSSDYDGSPFKELLETDSLQRKINQAQIRR